MPPPTVGGPDAAHWAEFWSEPERARGGCLAGNAALAKACAELWRDFARRLPKRARVLDAATGDGVVLTRMAAARPDLKLLGIDYAPTLPPAPPGMTLRCGIAMDDLPFPDARFDALTSQFGFEYGAGQAAAGELSRVLAPGAPFQFLVHHAASPVVVHGRQRREAIDWAAFGSGGIERAQRLAAARAAVPLATPPAFAAAVAEARRRFPGQPVAAEIAGSILDLLRRSADARYLADALALIEKKARSEIASLDALQRAARDEEGIAALRAMLDAAGLRATACAPVDDPQSRRPFAWLLRGAKRPAQAPF